MKNLKALEILKLNMIVQVLNEENRVKLSEAIEELEALQNRSCDNCKKRPSPFSECPCWSYSFGKSNISLCSEWESK